MGIGLAIFLFGDVGRLGSGRLVRRFGYVFSGGEVDVRR